jgi:hypothetical protein
LFKKLEAACMVFPIEGNLKPKGEIRVKNASKVTFLLLAALSILFTACNGSENGAKQPSDVGAPVIAAEAVSFNYGQVEEGTKVVHVFKIKNEGDGILVIQKATGS